MQISGVDMLNWGVCVMKEYNSNFLACFCSTKVTFTLFIKSGNNSI